MGLDDASLAVDPTSEGERFMKRRISVVAALAVATAVAFVPSATTAVGTDSSQLGGRP